MRKAIAIGMAAAMVFIGIMVLAPPAAAGAKNVEYTFHMATFGQPGPWQASGAGVPLFSDGSAIGHIAISTGNGKLILHGHPTGWFAGGPGIVSVVMGFHKLKDEIGFPLPPVAVLSFPVTGSPVFQDVDGDGQADLVFWLQPVN